ncbi:MAG TPA: hypothetical protein VN923_19095 [Thermoanaerobaculia bacterium]|nr:hypothetical protein [Thermoanaerobaculia bacterium]
MRLRRALVSSFLPLFVMALAALATPADAAGNFAAKVEGSFTDGAGEGTFEGTLTLSKFERRGDRLTAVGTLDGALVDAAGKRLGEVEDRAVSLPIESSSLAASCERAALTVRLEDVEAGGVRAHLQPVRVEIGAGAVPNHRLDAPLCELGKVVGPSADLGAVAQHLDAVLAALE